MTAQKQDIGDPQVVSEFARKVGDESHLDYLYVLTCADVRGTNPKLWNSWKASLFHEFYERVKRALRRGLETPVDQDELMREHQDSARALLRGAGMLPAAIERAWARLPTAYFLRHAPEEIARHTRALAAAGEGGDAGEDEALVSVEPQSERGTTAVMIYAPHRRHGFARATAVLDQLGLNILEARITPVGNGFSLDSYHVLEEDGSAIGDRRTARRDRTCALGLAAASRRSAAGGIAPRDPADARLQDADPDQRSVSMSAIAARCWNSRPATGPGCCAMSARCCGRSASICTPPRSAPSASAPRTCSTSPIASPAAAG